MYWIPVYQILESRGLEVYLVNAQHVKNVRALARQAGRDIDVYTVGVVTCRPTLREAEEYYRHCIVDNADLVDGAMIFGTGYAPFRGGPLNYARTRGADNVVSALRALAEKFGGRFTPDAGWENFK